MVNLSNLSLCILGIALIFMLTSCATTQTRCCVVAYAENADIAGQPQKSYGAPLSRHDYRWNRHLIYW